jgi:murein DD-endopeptidase MepM/ murein hydrolase activator NlpD
LRGIIQVTPPPAPQPASSPQEGPALAVSTVAATDATLSHALHEANQFLSTKPTLDLLSTPEESGPGLIWPISSTVITSDFGRRNDPIHGRRRAHQGVDVRADEGTPVYAAAPGRVELTDYSSRTGLFVRIDHGNEVFTRYAHLSEVSVAPGERVAAGQIIGRSGATGRVTGPHLHFEVNEGGKPQDPLSYDWKVISNPATDLSFEAQAIAERGVDIEKLDNLTGMDL